MKLKEEAQLDEKIEAKNSFSFKRSWKSQGGS